MAPSTGRKLAVRLACLGAVLAVGAGSSGSAYSGPNATPPGLLLWNTLGSTYAVTHSAYGPNLVLFDCNDPTTPHFGPRCSIDIRGKLAFVDGPYGTAATIARAGYFPEARVHTALLEQSLLNPERGAVEAWYRQTKDPVPFRDNPHRIFAGGYNLGGAGDVNLQVQDRIDTGDPRLHFSVFDATPADDHGAARCERSQIGPISKLTAWIHISGVRESDRSRAARPTRTTSGARGRSVRHLRPVKIMAAADSVPPTRVVRSRGC